MEKKSIEFDVLEELMKLSEEYCRSGGKLGIPSARFSDDELEVWVMLNKHFRHGQRSSE